MPDDFEPTQPPCPACGGPTREIGALGHTAHYRCRHCGTGFAAPAPGAEYGGDDDGGGDSAIAHGPIRLR